MFLHLDVWKFLYWNVLADLPRNAVFEESYSKDQRKEQQSAVVQRLNITSSFKRTVSVRGTGTLSVQSLLSMVCAWRCSKWSSVSFSLFMIPLRRSKSLQAVRIIWSSLSNHIYTHSHTHTHTHIYVLTYQGTWGKSEFSPFFLTYWHFSCCQFNSGRPET